MFQSLAITLSLLFTSSLIFIPSALAQSVDIIFSGVVQDYAVFTTPTLAQIAKVSANHKANFNVGSSTSIHITVSPEITSFTQSWFSFLPYKPPFQEIYQPSGVSHPHSFLDISVTALTVGEDITVASLPLSQSKSLTTGNTSAIGSHSMNLPNGRFKLELDMLGEKLHQVHHGVYTYTVNITITAE